MVGFAGAIQFKKLIVPVGEFRHAVLLREVAGLLSGSNGFFKTSRFGISSGERPEKSGLLIVRKTARVFGQLNRFLPVADLRV